MFSSDFWSQWFHYLQGIIVPSIGATIRMTVISMVVGVLAGLILAIFMVIWREGGLRPRTKLYAVLSFVINIVRSFPIIILIVAISPITRVLVGTTVGEAAAIVPLSIAATAFMARIIEGSLVSVDKQLIEAAQSFGASTAQIIFDVMMREAVPSLVSGFTLGATTFLTATTLAGAVGAGGIGAVALNYGYQSFNDSVLYTSVIFLIILVQVIQSIGNRIYAKVR